MNRCPKCGLQEPVMWRLSRFDPEQERADAYDVETHMPELWQLIKDKESKDIPYNGYVYRLRRGGRSVIRLEETIYKSRGKMHGEATSSKRTYDRFQHRNLAQELAKQTQLL